MEGEVPAGAPPQFLIHDEGDSVAVAVTALEPGRVEGAVLKSGRRCEFEILRPVPLGHKFAVTELTKGADVIKYGVRVAVATKDIAIGEYVHVENVRSARWQNSVA
ncbi:UxaA family hydrolase [Actinoallomurus oryzae]|jgi:(2R)-sulfolactate sulfo-lyase subunit alpha|uniref:UxaA family hydrolase n=1 Tax=Actinoallomurus oryzae TaxID=502180 RepID=A0ABP8QF62_9ACTN|nr:UxaA family hydrolase [Actinoallomurus sp. NBC_01490]